MCFWCSSKTRFPEGFTFASSNLSLPPLEAFISKFDVPIWQCNLFWIASFFLVFLKIHLCVLLQAIVKNDTELYYNYCVYDSDISTGFGAGSFLFLLASQILVMVASRCFCCGKALRPGGSRACAIILFLICWYIFLPNHINCRVPVVLEYDFQDSNVWKFGVLHSDQIHFL